MTLTATRSERSVPATPIVKWVGGKTRLLPALTSRVPPHARYFEPFAGGAALFFALRPAQAVLGDANADLINAYRELANDVEAVIERLRVHAGAHDKAHYYTVREAWNAGVRDAAAFLYLNRACYNGLWRVNRAGEMNTPAGSYAEVRFDIDNLRAAAAALARAEMRAGDYRSTTTDAREGDFVYLDPPYDGTYGGYTSERFDQAELAAYVHEIVSRGCHVLLSNSDTPLIRSLYADLHIEVVSNSRSVNANGDGRGMVNELLISNTRRDMRQTYFEGTAPPDDPQIQEVADAVDAWLAARKKQALAAEATKIRNATMLELLTEHGIERYPYHDDEGRKRYVVADKTPRAKTVKAPSRKQEGRAHDDTPPAVEVELEFRRTKPDGEVESRRVPRTAEHDKAADPFASTRAGLIEEAEKRQKEEWKVGEERGASPDGGKPLKASIAERTKKRGGKKPKLEVVPDAPAEDAS